MTARNLCRGSWRWTARGSRPRLTMRSAISVDEFESEKNHILKVFFEFDVSTEPDKPARRLTVARGASIGHTFFTVVIG